MKTINEHLLLLLGKTAFILLNVTHLFQPWKNLALFIEVSLYSRSSFICILIPLVWTTINGAKIDALYWNANFAVRPSPGWAAIGSRFVTLAPLDVCAASASQGCIIHDWKRERNNEVVCHAGHQPLRLRWHTAGCASTNGGPARVRKVATLSVKVNDNKSGWSLIGRRGLFYSSHSRVRRDFVTQAMLGIIENLRKS